VNRAVHASAAQKRGIGGIDDRVHFHFGDIVSDDDERHCIPPGCFCFYCSTDKKKINRRLPMK